MCVEVAAGQVEPGEAGRCGGQDRGGHPGERDTGQGKAGERGGRGEGGEQGGDRARGEARLTQVAALQLPRQPDHVVLRSPRQAAE